MQEPLEQVMGMCCFFVFGLLLFFMDEFRTWSVGLYLALCGQWVGQLHYLWDGCCVMTLRLTS